MQDRNIGDHNSMQGEIQSDDTITNFTDDERRQWILDLSKNWCINSSSQALTFSNNAIKTCLLLNGMACVAILAYLGSLSGKNIGVTHVQIISLLCFASGCASVAVCLFFSYLAQCKFTHFAERKMTGTTGAEKDEFWGKVCNWCAIIFGAVSLGFFIAGAAFFAAALW